jgi:hypothetical protein
MSKSQQTLLLVLIIGQQKVKQPTDSLLVLIIGQQNVKQPTDSTVGAVYRTSECQTANRLYCWCCSQDSRMSNSQQTLLLMLIIGQQNVKNPTDTIVGADYWKAECQKANRLYCWC